MEAVRASRTQTNSGAATALARRSVQVDKSSVRSTPLYAGPPAIRLSASITKPPQSSLPAPVAQLVSSLPPGEPLRSDIRERLESSLQVDLQDVRVHTDQRTAGVVDELDARAFTYGCDIFLGSGERATDLGLIGHEAAHIVQQRQGSVNLQMYASASATGMLEQEAQHAATAVQSGEQVVVTGRTNGPQVQKEDVPWWKRAVGAVGGGVKAVGTVIGKGAQAVGTAVKSGVSAAIEWTEGMGWDLLKQYAPELVSIIQQGGIVEWLKKQISSAIETVFNTLMAPVRAVKGVVESLNTHFSLLLAWMQDAAAKIAKGDCSSISEAADKIQKVIDGFASPIIDRVKQLAKQVGQFFTGLWDRFGAPVWDFLKRAGGQVWEKIQQFGSWVWSKTEPIRRGISRAWTWIKNKLGIGEGEEGQNGLLQWVQRHASTAWNALKPKIEPLKKPLLVVGGVLLLLSPAGPLVAIGAGVAGLIVGIRWIRQHWHTPQLVIQMRETLHNTIIPGIMGAVNGVKSTLAQVTTSISNKLHEIMGGVGQIAKAVAEPILGFAREPIQWISDQFSGLSHWASEKLAGVTSWINKGLSGLHSYLQPVWQALRKIIGFVVNPFSGLQGLIAGPLWKSLPQCLKSNIINFILDMLINLVRIARFILDATMLVPLLGPLWSLIRAAMLGFLQQIRAKGDEVKIPIVDRFVKLGQRVASSLPGVI